MVSYVVTGANRGIGLAFAQAIHERNPQDLLFAIVRNPDSSTELKKLASPNVHIIAGDLDRPETLHSAAAQVAHITGGSLDVFINNAALVPSERMEYTLSAYIGKDDLLTKDLNTFYKTNVVGAVAATNAFLPLIEKGTQKKVINISSAAGDSEFIEKTEDATAVAYAVSKAALNLINMKYAVEFRGKGYTFLAISPGLVETRTGTHTAAEDAGWNAMIDKFKGSDPDWNGVPLLPRQSADLVLGVIDRATPEESGAFVSQYGDKRWL